MMASLSTWRGRRQWIKRAITDRAAKKPERRSVLRHRGSGAMKRRHALVVTSRREKKAGAPQSPAASRLRRHEKKAYFGGDEPPKDTCGGPGGEGVFNRELDVEG
jgi:hypothetical protein